MKIGLVIYGDIDQKSGGYAYDRHFVEFLQGKGAEVEILSLPRGNYLSCLWHNRDPRIRTKLLQWEGSVMIQDELTHPSLFWLNRNLRRKNIPILGLVHHLRIREKHQVILKNFVYVPIEKAFLESLGGILYNSRTSRDDVESLLKHTMPGPIATPAPHDEPTQNANDFSNRKNLAETFRILFVGSLTPRKNLEILLRALKVWKHKNWSLTVVGEGPEGPYVKRCRTLASALGDRVAMKGFLETGDLWEAYGRHHVLAVPSDYEGFGMVYLEAMVQGCVPLGGNLGGAREVIGNAGFLVRPRSAPEIVQALDRARDPATWRSLSEAARARATTFSDWKTGFEGFWSRILLASENPRAGRHV